MKNRKWKEFRLAELFQVKRGKRLVESSRIAGMRRKFFLKTQSRLICLQMHFTVIIPIVQMIIF